MAMKGENKEEVLSRLMDGEWDELDATRCVADVCESKEMQEKWARFHLARDVMRNEVVDPSMSIAAGVSAALADEPAYSNITSFDSSVSDVRNDNVGAAPIHRTTTSSESRARSRWGMGAAGFGIAASAALATVFGMDFLQGQNTLSPQAIVAGVNAPLASPVQTLPALVNQGGSSQIELVSNRGSYWVSSQDGQRADTEARLNHLLGDHIEQTTASDWRGMMPYSRLVGYDASEVQGQ